MIRLIVYIVLPAMLMLVVTGCDSTAPAKAQPTAKEAKHAVNAQSDEQDDTQVAQAIKETTFRRHQV